MNPYIKPYVIFFTVAGIVVLIMVFVPLDAASVFAMLCPVAFFVLAPLAIFSMLKGRYFRR